MGILLLQMANQMLFCNSAARYHGRNTAAARKGEDEREGRFALRPHAPPPSPSTGLGSTLPIPFP